MKKLLPILAALCLIASDLWAACVGPSQSDVVSAISSAARGDTIDVCAGSATWSSTTGFPSGYNDNFSGALIITKGLTLRGAGIDSTVITHTLSGNQSTVAYLPDATAIANNETFELSGFTFNFNSGGTGIGGIYIGNNSSSTVTSNLKIHGNKLRNLGGRGVYTAGMTNGVIYSNQFENVTVVLGPYGRDYDSWHTQTQAYGTADNLYFEDNTIFFTTNIVGYSGWIETGQGGRVAVRYNTWDYSNIVDADELWDVHGLQTPTGSGGCTENYSTMVAEYYGNKIVDAVGMNRWMFHRGGWLAMFFNTFAGTYNPPNQHAGQYYCNSTACTGSYNQKVSNTYIFRNLANGTEAPMSIVEQSPGCISDPIVENADLFNYKSSFTGTQGVGVGTLAARPATCTTGVGYWASNQSLTDLSTMTGASPLSPLAGVLYKCTATNTWTAYYIPYTYPHPLRVGGDTTPPTVSNPLPSGAQAYSSNPQNVTLQVTTNEAATCRMSTSNIAYASMTDTFTTTGSTAHSEVKSLDAGASYLYYVQCSDTSGNVTSTPAQISFSIDSPPVVRRTYGSGTIPSLH